MHSIDLTSLTFEELETLGRDVSQEKQDRLDRERTAILEQAKQLADRHGLTLDEVLGTQRKRRSVKSRRPRNSDNPVET